MGQDQHGAAQPIFDVFEHPILTAEKYYSSRNPVKKVFSGSSTDAGKLPPQWEEANKRSAEAQLKTETPVKTPHKKRRPKPQPYKSAM